MGTQCLIQIPQLQVMVSQLFGTFEPLMKLINGEPINITLPTTITNITNNTNAILNQPIIRGFTLLLSLILIIIMIPLLLMSFIFGLPAITYIKTMLKIFHPEIDFFVFVSGHQNTETYLSQFKIITPYVVQCFIIYSIIGGLIGPLIANRILKKIGFYKRIPQLS